jgi:murein DD-endopeptidase MepM/ murein hydrolase activator NlpD
MKNFIILTICLIFTGFAFLITGCFEKEVTGPDNTNTSNAPPKVFGSTPNTYDSFPDGWKFPFSGSWQISVGYNGVCCDGSFDSYHTGKERYAIDWNLTGENDFRKPVLAPASGWVMYADLRGCWGKTVVVNAGNGYYYRVAHLDRIDVVAGWWVPRGYKLGLAGKTGCVDGTHIHFAVYYPASYAGYGNVNGNTVPQNGISGQWDLRVCSWYNSGQ